MAAVQKLNAISINPRKGMRKTNVDSANLFQDFGKTTPMAASGHD
jgi:hypothetical protein